jgi:hypothetical protein
MRISFFDSFIFLQQIKDKRHIFYNFHNKSLEI